MAILKLKNKTTGEWEEIQAIKGNGISSIEKTATVGNKDTYTIYFTNGETTTYEVENGEVTRGELQEEVDRLSMIYNAFPSTTGEGEEASINGTAEVPFKEIGLKGNTSQEGTPTPDTPIPVNVVTGDNSIEVVGKNLCFNITKHSNANLKFFINKSISKTFTISFTTNEALNGNGLYLEVDGTSYGNLGGITANANTKAEKTYTLSDTNYQAIKNGTNIDLLLYKNGANFNIPDDCMVENNSTATEYEPYQSTTYPINLGSMELCKIGDYQDYIYKDNGRWYKHKVIGKVVLNGSEGWYKHGGIASWFYYDGIIDGYILDNTQILIKTNYYTPKAYLGVPNIVNGECAYGSSDSSGVTHRFVIKNTDYTQTNDFKNWLSTHNTIVYYVLATPTITEITDTTLIEQLDNLEKAYSYDTQTNISQTNQDKPFIISYEAILSLKNVLNNLETRIAVLETE